MKDLRFSTLQFLTLCVLGVALSGCGGGSTASTSAPAPTSTVVNSVTVSCSPATVAIGATSACAATVSGTGTISENVSWASTNGTISASGVFTATVVGNASVTATSAQDATKSGSASVTVTAPAPTVSGVAVSCAPTSINVGATSACTATVSGANSPPQNVTWTATGGTITSAGVFTATTAGTSTITATSVQDATKFGTATVTVQPPGTATGVTVSCTPATLTLGASTACAAAVSGSGTPSQVVTWTTGSGSVTDTGAFTPAAVGMQVVTATSVEDPTKSGSFSLAVLPAVSPEIDFGAGQSPEMIVDSNGAIDLAWAQTNSSATVEFARSTDHGASFKTSAVTSASTVQMGVDAQGVISLLTSSSSSPNDYGFSTDGGETFSFSGLSSIIGNSTSQLNVSPDGLVNLTGFSLGTPLGREIFSMIVDRSSTFPPVQVVGDIKDDVSEVTSAIGPQGQVYVAWIGGTDATPECPNMFSASLGAGVTFSTPMNISNNPSECAQLPAIFVDPGGGVNLVWTTWHLFSDDNGPLSNPNVVFFARSTDQGLTFSAPAALVGINQYAQVNTPQVVVEKSGTIDVVFGVQNSSDSIVLFAQSRDGGATFSSPVTVATGGATNPTIAVDSCGGIDVAWVGTVDLFYARSTDGSTFSPPTNISNAHTTQFSPSISTDSSGSAFVLWRNSTDVLFQGIKLCE
jgi:hypothetical protein